MCTLLLVCSSLTVARERVALVIGNAAYPGLDKLKNPVNDAKDVAYVLGKLDFDVTLVTDANGEKMQDAIELFGEKLGKDTAAVFYYSGHGVQYLGENYLIPVDVQDSSILSQNYLSHCCIILGKVVQKMEEKGCDVNFIMLDACRKNDFKDNLKNIDPREGLAYPRKARGTFFSYATSPGEEAKDGDEHNSPYTKQLVNVMRKPYLDYYAMFNEIISLVQSETTSETETEQIPWIEGSLGIPFVFNKGITIPPPPPEKPDLNTTALFTAGVVYSGLSDTTFMRVLGGKFEMGSPADEVGRHDDETQHEVKLRTFYMSKHELTVGEFRKFVEATRYSVDSRSLNGQENHPVVYVSWNDAVAYCEWLTRTTGKRYRLPTEAEWEYACRAWTTTSFNTGTSLTTDQANYNGNFPYIGNQRGKYRQTTVQGDFFAPNALGLYNMHGNVLEWCSDQYGTYPSETVKNPVGPSSGSQRVVRGGMWGDDAVDCRSAIRCSFIPARRGSDVGFRLVWIP
jgi:formylglycine-generating enzyme required for sulfatase activity